MMQTYEKKNVKKKEIVRHVAPREFAHRILANSLLIERQLERTLAQIQRLSI